MVTRQHTSELLEAYWGCNRCAAQGSGANAQALAAQHFDHRGHEVWFVIKRRGTYSSATSKSAHQQGKLV